MVTSILVLAGALAFGAWAVNVDVPARAPVAQAAPTVDLYQGKPIEWWAARAVHNRKRLNQHRRNSEKRGATIKRLQRLVRRKYEPSFEDYWTAASIAYGVDRATLERKTRCESVNLTDFFNEGSHASGAMQFLPSTWATTPFAHLSVFNHLFNVMAGAWMHKQGRGGEWVCR